MFWELFKGRQLPLQNPPAIWGFHPQPDRMVWFAREEASLGHQGKKTDL